MELNYVSFPCLLYCSFPIAHSITDLSYVNGTLAIFYGSQYKSVVDVFSAISSCLQARSFIWAKSGSSELFLAAHMLAWIAWNSLLITLVLGGD